MNSSITESLVKTGIIQFGRFGEEHTPLKINLHLLPSYPSLLSKMVNQITLLQSVERLLCTPDSLPLAIGLSLNHRIPLAYSQDGNLPDVHDIIGAYDIGHPTIFVTNTWNNKIHHTLIEKAEKVGLKVNQVITIVDYANEVSKTIEVQSLLQLNKLINSLVQVGRLPYGQAVAIKKWLLANHLD